MRGSEVEKRIKEESKRMLLFEVQDWRDAHYSPGDRLRGKKYKETVRARG